MATKASVESDIIRLLGEKIESDLTLTADTNIVADTGLDSVFELEDEFGITVPLDRISDVKTVGQLTDAVYGLIEEAA